MRNCHSLNPPVRPVCPEAPVWPVRPLAPTSSRNASHSVTCLPFPVQCSDDLPCLHTLIWIARVWTHLWDPSAQRPRSRLWSRSPLQAVEMPHILSHACPSLRKALRDCHACILWYGKPESEPTCETRLPRSSGLACKTARPYKQTQCLTYCQIPALLCAKLWGIAMLAYIGINCQGLNPPVRPVCPEAPVSPVEPLAPASSRNASHIVRFLPFSVQSSEGLPCLHTLVWKARVWTHLWDPSAQKLRSGLWDRSPLQAVEMPHIVSHACPSQCSALMICHACIRWYGLPGSEPTCETRLPRSPGLACGAARPCKQSPSLTMCHTPSLFCIEVW